MESVPKRCLFQIVEITAPFCLDDWFKIDFGKTKVFIVLLIVFSGVGQPEILGLLVDALRHSGVFYTGSNDYGKQQQARINCGAGVVVIIEIVFVNN